MIIKKTPLAIAIASVLTMPLHVNASQVPEYEILPEDGRFSIQSEGRYVVKRDVVENISMKNSDVSADGLTSITVQTKGKVSDGISIISSKASPFIIRNNGNIGVESESPAILISNSSITGDFSDAFGERVILVNSGDIDGDDAIRIERSNTIRGSIINHNGGIIFGESDEGDEGIGISLQEVNFTGNIRNIGSGSLSSTDIVNFFKAEKEEDLVGVSVIAGGSAGIVIEDSKFIGNIVNSGLIATNFDLQNDGAKNFQGAAIYVSGSDFIGNINNTGTIFGTKAGIYIKDDVLGSVVINQTGGLIKAETAIRLNNSTTVNYTGGSIIGDVDNYGGTFYVEGNRVIDGDYWQNKNATLSLGLHKDTSLTADNINLAEGSKLLVDVSKGTLFVASGDELALLIVKDGDLELNKVNPEVIGNQLVTIKSFKVVDGKLKATFERTSFEEVVKSLQNSNEVTGQQATNFASVATSLQSLGTLATTNPAVASLLNSIDGSADSFNRLLPDNTGASVASARVASNMSNNQVSVRARGVASGDMVDTTGVWIQAMGANAKQKTRDGIDGYDADSWGLVLGSDVELNSGHVLGAAYSYINNDSDSRLSSSDTDYHMLTGYWGYAHGNLLMDAQVYYGKGNTDASRQALNNTTASASYDSSLYGVRAAAGYQFDLGNETSFVPTLSLEHSRLSVDGYTETGSANNLIVGKQKSDRLELGLTGELSRTYQVNQNLVTPRVTLGAFHDFEADRQSINAAFAVAPSATFTSQGAKPNKTRYVAGVGVDLINANDLTISAEYNYNWESSFRANAGAIKLRWEF